MLAATAPFAGHHLGVLERQLGNEKVRFDPSDRVFLAALSHRVPLDVLRKLRLLVRPDTVLRWHRDLVARRHAAGSRPKRPGQPRAAVDALLADAGVQVVKTGIRVPRMNSIMERWIQTCRRGLLDRILIWNQRHLLHALCEFETFYNEHRPHRTLGQAAPCRLLPDPISDQALITRLDIRRNDRLAVSSGVPACGLTWTDG